MQQVTPSVRDPALRIPWLRVEELLRVGEKRSGQLWVGEDDRRERSRGAAGAKSPAATNCGSELCCTSAEQENGESLPAILIVLIHGGTSMLLAEVQVPSFVY